LQRVDQRQGFLVSAVVHLVIVTILSSGPFVSARKAVPAAPREERSRVFLPPPEVLRELAGRRQPSPRAVPTPRPAPTPPNASAKDRISIGAPSPLRAKGPLVLRRDDDLTQVPKGRPDAQPTPVPTPPPSASPSGSASGAAGGATRATPEPNDRLSFSGLRRPDPPSGSGRGAAGPEPGSISSALRGLDRRLLATGPQGLPTGTGRQMGPLFFDPLGADFTSWINRFKNEVYRNWIVPQAAMIGWGGQVEFEFSVQRDGRLTGLQMLSSSGTPSLDRAARNALLGSILMELPADYGPSSITMRVTFYYGKPPEGS
jgi:TonB family protein